ncbi:hypothetical protein C8A03DRAFT_15455 [Achaetomium macrosporum]|uniref:Apolipoprotein/apolipophorin n=1 Tax=Achaetomium macrosporum TaxID=79813 RepID=A0AAN7CAP9_9PEZI|nr:hypothetical protein C8A03DRAFT_15455 [Achaetomium macrosporum]
MFSARFPTRVAPGAARNARAIRAPRPQRRFQSTQSSGTSSNHFMSGVAGGVAGAGLLYGIYLMTPSGKTARKVNAAAKEIDNKYQQVAATIKDKTPTTDEAVDKLKQFCYSYVAWVPGGRQYVDSAFNDLEAVRKEHGEEVDKIVSETYKEFQDIARTGLSFETMSKAYDALANLARKIASLSGSAADQLLERHPQLNDKVGEPIRQLKQMGKNYGPEARKLVDETWSQVNDALSSGFSVETADKVRKIVEERIEQLRKIGDDLWNKRLEEAKPYLDKNPRVKELITENQDALKQGNVMALFGQLKKLGEAGDKGKLEDYVKQAVDKAKSTGAKAAGGSSGFGALGQVLGTSSDEAGRMIQENIGLLTEVANKHASEGKELLEETRDDLKKMLEEKANKARKIADKAKSGQ